MALAHSPKIITDGLVLCLDAGNTKSYPGSGTTWTDLSGNGNNGTLLNGVGYSGNNLGSLSFDGVNDYVGLPHSSLLDLGSELTFCGFVKFNDIADNPRIFSTLDVQFGTYTEGIVFYIRTSGLYGIDTNTLAIQFGKNGWSWNVYGSNGITINDNEYHYVAVTATNLNTSSPTIKFYIDSNSVDGTFWTAASKGAIRYSSTTNSIRLGSAYTASDPSYSEAYSDLNIGDFKIYNKALTASEIQQNFNALRGRFGI